MTLASALSTARALRVLPSALLAHEVPRARPIHMHLEHTTVCDHVCSTCIRATSKGGEVHMPTAEAIGYIDDIAPKYLSLNGIGEPLMHPEWDVIVDHATKLHGAKVGFASTGTHFSDQAERICRSDLGLVKVSFHGASPGTFSRLASGRSLEVVKRGIRDLFAAKRKLGRGPSVRLNYVVSEDSLSEMPEAVRVAKQCDVPAIYFKGALVPQGRRSGLAGMHSHTALSAAIYEAAQLAKEAGINTNLDHWRSELECAAAVPEGEDTAPKGRCLIPWISIFVRVDGTVLPCCNCTFRPDEGQLGRIGVDGPFKAVWQGAKYANLRREFREDKYSLPICQSCPDPVTARQIGGSARAKVWPGFLSD